MIDPVWLWAVAGLVLIAADFVFATFVLCFLGLAAVLIAPLVWFGLLPGIPSQMVVWLVLSMGLVLVLRSAIRSRFAGDSEVGEIDEDSEAFARTATVVEAIPAGGEGRIEFDGSSWPATCLERAIDVGLSVRVLYREGLTWVVIPEEAVEAVAGQESAATR